MTISTKNAFHVALLAGAVGLSLFAAAPASAQDSDIIVSAPRFHTSPEGQRLNGPLEKVSLSTHVRYDDLNLRTWRGARELKMRVRDAAQDTCTRLAEAYPVKQQFGTSCYKDALENGELRANAAIRDARDQRYED